MDFKNAKNIKKIKTIILIVFITLINSLYIIMRNSIPTNNILPKETMEQEYYQKDQENLNFKEEKPLENPTNILEIPKINLKEAVPDINSTQNNVNKNIYVVKETIFPGTGKTSHIILAAHSGYNKISFFKRLPELKKDDIINFYYKNKQYTYKIVQAKEIEKNGTMIWESTFKDDITLITCLKGTNKQIVYQGILTYTSNL